MNYRFLEKSVSFSSLFRFKEEGCVTLASPWFVAQITFSHPLISNTNVDN